MGGTTSVLEGGLERNSNYDNYDRGMTATMTRLFEGCLEPNANYDNYDRIWGPSSSHGHQAVLPLKISRTMLPSLEGF